GAGWIFEVKWDGYRAIATVRGSEVALTSRNGNDLTTRFANVAKEVTKAVKTPDCVADGEVCALDDSGRSSFSAMQQGKPGTPLARGRGGRSREPKVRERTLSAAGVTHVAAARGASPRARRRAPGGAAVHLPDAVGAVESPATGAGRRRNSRARATRSWMPAS